jgi:hypothetical protein
MTAAADRSVAVAAAMPEVVSEGRATMRKQDRREPVKTARKTQKPAPADTMMKTTAGGDIELTEEQLGRASGGACCGGAHEPPVRPVKP